MSQTHFSKIISGSLFAGAGTALILGKWGSLSLPGIGAVLFGLIFLRYNSLLAMAVGLLSASCSFAAQSYYGVCQSCTLAAGLFAVAGLVLYPEQVERYPKQSFGCVVPFVISLFLFVFTGNFLSALPTFQESRTVASGQEKALLFYSPLCGSCQEILQIFIKNDPQGNAWKPVVVPASLVVREKHNLTKQGFTGEISSVNKSPTGKVPCLFYNGRFYEGKAITRLVKEGGFSEEKPIFNSFRCIRPGRRTFGLSDLKSNDSYETCVNSS